MTTARVRNIESVQNIELIPEVNAIRVTALEKGKQGQLQSKVSWYALTSENEWVDIQAGADAALRKRVEGEAFLKANQGEAAAENFWLMYFKEYNAWPERTALPDSLETALDWWQVFTNVRPIIPEEAEKSGLYAPSWFHTNILSRRQDNENLHPGVTCFKYGAAEHLAFSGTSAQKEQLAEYKKTLEQADIVFSLGTTEGSAPDFYSVFSDIESKPCGDQVDIYNWKPGEAHSSHTTQICHIRSWKDHHALDFDLATIKLFLSALESGKTIGVHCRGGVGRTGTLLFAFQLKNKFSECFLNDEVNIQNAIDLLEKLRMDRPGLVQTGLQFRMALVAAQQMKLVEYQPDISEAEFKRQTEQFKIKLNHAAQNFQPSQKQKPSLLAEVQALDESKWQWLSSFINGAVGGYTKEIQIALNCMTRDYAAQGRRVKNFLSGIKEAVFFHSGDSAIEGLNMRAAKIVANKNISDEVKLYAIVQELIRRVNVFVKEHQKEPKVLSNLQDHHAARMIIVLLFDIQKKCSFDDKLVSPKIKKTDGYGVLRAIRDEIAALRQGLEDRHFIPPGDKGSIRDGSPLVIGHYTEFYRYITGVSLTEHKTEGHKLTD